MQRGIKIQSLSLPPRFFVFSLSFYSIVFSSSLFVITHSIGARLTLASPNRYKLKVNLLTIGYALTIGWISSAFLLYDSDDSPLPSGRVSMSEIAWIGSIIGIGGLIGTIVMGWCSDQFGRKNSLLAMAIPQIVSIPLRHIPPYKHNSQTFYSMSIQASKLIFRTYFTNICRLAFC